MKIIEMLMDEAELDETRQVWARRGNTISRKFRCTSGPRKGRVVASPEQCNKAFDIKKRVNMKKTKARLGGKMARKARRTKRINPHSIRLRRLNKRK